jgi:putative flippase GtrA
MQIIKYAYIGGLCTVVDFTIFIIFTKVFSLHYLLVSTASFSVAVLLNYYLCINHLFQGGVRFTRSMEVLSFFIISVIGLLIHQSILYCAVDFLGVEIVSSKAIATASVFTWNYLGRKCFVFRPPQSDTGKV